MERQELVRELSKVLEMMKIAIKYKDADEFSYQDVLFHETIIRSIGPWLRQYDVAKSKTCHGKFHLIVDAPTYRRGHRGLRPDPREPRPLHRRLSKPVTANE